MRILLVVLVLFPLLSGIQAQTVSGVEANLMYARGLVQRRMHGLAEKVLERILDAPSASEGDRASVLLETANLHRDRFLHGFTRAERLAASEMADAAYREFITRHPEHPRIIEAMADHGEYLMFLGRHHLHLQEESLLAGEEPDVAEAHRAGALEKLRKAADLFDELLVVIPAPDRIEEVRYNRVTLYYLMARAEKEEATRLAAFQDAINNLEDYIFENEDNLRGYWGYLYMGLCLREFREEEFRRDAIACFERTIQTAGTGDYLMDPAVRDLLENATWRLAETLNRFGRFQTAVEKIDEIEKVYRKYGFQPGAAGYRALLEKARAFFLAGDSCAAVKVASGVSERAGLSSPYIQHRCSRFLAEVLDTIEGRPRFDAKVLVMAARGAYGRQRYCDAIRFFRVALDLDEVTPADALDCWDFLGRCYRSLGFLRESALAHATGAFRYRSVDENRAMDLARRARRTLTMIHGQTRSTADRARLEAHREKMGREFGEAPPAPEKFEVARARALFSRVSEAEKMDRGATRMQAFKDVLESADEFLDQVQKAPPPGEPGQEALRSQALGIAHLVKVMAYKGLEKWDEGLASLEYFRKGSGSGRDILMKAAVLGIHCRIGKRALGKAEEEFLALKQRFPGARKIHVNLTGILGAEYRALANRHAGERRTDLSEKALLKSVAYRLAWVEATHPSIETLVSLGKDLYSLNHFDRALFCFEKALERPAKKSATSLRLARLYLARCLVWQGKYVEAEPILRRLYEKRKRDLRLFKEYAALLTGTVKFYDGKLNFIPGLGASRQEAIKGFRLWKRITGRKNAMHEYLCVRFHQNLVRWAQDKGVLARKSIRQLRIHLGKTLDRKVGSPEEGFWESRFKWLERNLSRMAPRTPPPPPAPRG